MAESKERTQRTSWGMLCMSISVACFTVNALLVKFLSSSAQMSPWVILTARAVIGLFIVWICFSPSGTVHFRRAFTNRKLITRGLYGVFGTAAYYFTIEPLGPGKATLISNMFVVISAIMAVWILKESLSGIKFLGNLVALIGLAFLIGVTPTDLSVVSINELLALFGAFAGAGAVIVIRQLTLTETSATIYASQCIFVLLASIIPGFYLWSNMTGSEFGLLILSSVCASVGQLAMTDGFRHLTVAVGGAFQILVPVLIALGGVAIFDESFSALQVLGAILILVGCYSTLITR